MYLFLFYTYIILFGRSEFFQTLNPAGRLRPRNQPTLKYHLSGAYCAQNEHWMRVFLYKSE